MAKNQQQVGELVVDLKLKTSGFEAELDRIVAKFETLVNLAKTFAAITGPVIGFNPSAKVKARRRNGP